MKGYSSKWDISLRIARAYLPSGSTKEVRNIAKHEFAKRLVNFATIGKVNGKFVIQRDPIKKPKLP